MFNNMDKPNTDNNAQSAKAVDFDAILTAAMNEPGVKRTPAEQAEYEQRMNNANIDPFEGSSDLPDLVKREKREARAEADKRTIADLHEQIKKTQH